MPAPIKASDLDPEVRKQLGITLRNKQFTIEEVRRETLGVLAQVKHLTKAQRDRVLNHALKVNQV